MSLYSFSGAWLATRLIQLEDPPRGHVDRSHSLLPTTNALAASLPRWSSGSAGRVMRANCSMAVANCRRGSPTRWVLVFSWVRYAAARSWSPDRCLSAPTDSSYVASLGTQFRTSAACPTHYEVAEFISQIIWALSITSVVRNSQVKFLYILNRPRYILLQRRKFC
jgi:hypothetical protein